MPMAFISILRRLMGHIKKMKAFLFYRDVFVIFRASPNTESKLDSSFLNKLSDPETIHDIYIHLGRNFPYLNKIITSRINHGYTFFTFSNKENIIFTTWIAHNKPRFIDELAISINTGNNSIFVRDAFCLEKFRGNCYFSKVIALIIKQHYPNISYVFSDTVQSNSSSIRGHKRYGFEPLFKIHYSIILNKFLIRQVGPNNLSIKIYQGDKFIVSKNKEFKQCQRHLGLNNRQMATFCQVGERAVERWRSGKRKVPGPVWALLNMTEIWLEAVSGTR